MNILVIKSSPHKNGSSNILADNFIKGAEESGHSVTVFDAGHSNIHPCIACEACDMSARCVQRDDMDELRKMILASDMLVFVTPLYYFGVSAQLKVVIDRFYSFNDELTAKRLKSAMIVAATDEKNRTMRDIKSHYETLCRYLAFEDMGQILGSGCGNVSMTEKSVFPKKAYEFGKSLGKR